VVLGVLFFLLIVGIGGVVVANYKHFGNLFKVVSLINSRYLGPVNTTVLVDGAVRGLVESLGDPYSVYLDPETFSKILQEQIKGTIDGLGILVGVKDGYLAVVRSYPSTPAGRAGIVEGDVIVKIGDRVTSKMDLETAVGLIRGPVGTKVKLTIARKGVFQEKEMELTREQITVPTVEGYVLPETKIGYIMLAQFTERTPGEVSKVLEQLKRQGMLGLILDLRDNPGGELHAAVKVAENFVPRGPVVYIDYRLGKDETYSVDGRNLNLPLVILVNRATASAAEILAGAIKDRQAGILVGEKTFGKGIVQELFVLDHGAGLKLTTARYLTPSKHNIHKRGIVPDVVVAQGSRLEGKDLQRQKAVEILGKILKEAA
jgi:carboxyl-terminal processing protease